MKNKPSTGASPYKSSFLALVLLAFLAMIFSACKGPDGPEGPPGPTGPSGPTGTAGATGPAGPAGSTGAAGPAGSTGAAGAAGTNGQNFTDYLQNFNTFSFTPATAPLTTSAVNANWFVTTSEHFGATASGFTSSNPNKIQSGVIANSQTSNIAIAVNMPHSGTCIFEVSVSSENNFDYLNWYVDATKVNGISGIGGPFVFYFDIPSGVHTVSFKYEKDISFTGGSDAARLDNIQITNFAIGRLAWPDLPNTVSLWSERPIGLKK